MTLNLDFKVTIFKPIDALSVLCAPLTRDLLAIAKFLSLLPPTNEAVDAFARVCLSVCLSVSKITKKRVHAWIWMKCCVSTDVGTWTN